MSAGPSSPRAAASTASVSQPGRACDPTTDVVSGAGRSGRHRPSLGARGRRIPVPGSPRTGDGGRPRRTRARAGSSRNGPSRNASPANRRASPSNHGARHRGPGRRGRAAHPRPASRGAGACRSGHRPSGRRRRTRASRRSRTAPGGSRGRRPCRRGSARRARVRAGGRAARSTCSRPPVPPSQCVRIGTPVRAWVAAAASKIGRSRSDGPSVDSGDLDDPGAVLGPAHDRAARSRAHRCHRSTSAAKRSVSAAASRRTLQWRSS